MARGTNLKGPDGAKGRRLGASLGGKAAAMKPAPADCQWCREHGYTDLCQHNGHLGFTVYLKGKDGDRYSMSKADRTSIRWKLKHTTRKL